MKKIKIMFFVLASFFIALKADAEIIPNENLTEVKSEFELGPEVSWIKYEEPSFAQEEGWMAGVFGAYTARFPQKLVLGLDGRFSAGMVDYEGSGTIDGIWDFIFEVRGTAGYDLAVTQETRLTPYLGIGYRLLRDELGGEVSSTGRFGYDRQSEYLYLPIGVKTLTALNNDWSLALNAEFDVFLDGTQKSELGDAVAGRDTLVNDQNDGYGVRGSIKLAKAGEKYNYFVEPFIRYWNIDDSDVKVVTAGGNPINLAGFEPANHSTEIGARVGVQF